MPRKIIPGIKYKFHFLYLTSPLQLSSSDSEIVFTPPGCGFNADPLFFRPQVRFRAGIFLLNDARPKAANLISDVRDATTSTRAYLGVCGEATPVVCGRG
jgi:hypothetical protein